MENLTWCFDRKGTVIDDDMDPNNLYNGIDGFWSYAKTWLYHSQGVPKSYFDLYLREIEFKFNHRNEDIFSS